MRRSHAIAFVILLLLGAAGAWFASGGDTGPERPQLAPREAAAADAAVHAGGDAAANERELAPAPPEEPGEAVAAPPPAAPTGKLRVIVHDERGRALAGCHVSAAEHEATTDDAGTATFEVPAARTFVVVDPPAGHTLRGRSGWQNVRAGTTTDLTIVLSATTQRLFWCQLVAAEDGRSLPGVALRQQPGDGELRSDADGFVHVAVADDDAFLDVRAPGRSPCCIVPVAGHEVRTAALRVPLGSACTLQVSIVDAAGAPVADVGVKLSVLWSRLRYPREAMARALGGKSWLATSDVQGRLAIADLPLGISCYVQVTAPPHFAPLDALFWSFEAPREERGIVLPAAGAVHGKVTDAGGNGVADVTVQANAATDRPLPRVLEQDGVIKKVRTTTDGTFQLSGLAPGTWWVGLELGDAHQPTSTVVQVAAGRTAEIELRATAGLPVAGRAVAADGTPCRDVPIKLMIDGTFVAGVNTDHDGSFRFVSLPAGACELSTDPFETEMGLPGPVTVQAGDERVELRLGPVNGSISGRCGGANDAWVTAYRRDSGHVLGSRCDLDGSFFYRGLRAGTWDLVAFDRVGGAGAVGAVQVLSGRETAGVVIELVAGATLRPKHRDADEFVVTNGASVAGGDNLEDGLAGEARVPPGTWTVVFRHRGREIARREVTVRAGENRVVDGGR